MHSMIMRLRYQTDYCPTDNTTPLNMASEADRTTLSDRWDKVTVGSSELLAHAVNDEAKASFVLAHFKVRSPGSFHAALAVMSVH
jgi:hypothetical protein